MMFEKSNFRIFCLMLMQFYYTKLQLNDTEQGKENSANIKKIEKQISISGTLYHNLITFNAQRKNNKILKRM